MSQIFKSSSGGGGGSVTSVSGTSPIEVNGVSGTPQTGAVVVSFSGNAGIQIIDGDTGSISGSTVTIYANNTANNSGQSVSFNNSGTISTLNFTDSVFNTMIGKLSGKLSQTYEECTAVGWSAGSALTSGSLNSFFGLQAGFSVTTGENNAFIGAESGELVTTGSDNTALGQDSLANLISGSSNIVIGVGSATNYFASESSNIIIGNAGIATESNVIRIGTQGSNPTQQNKCFISGITGATPTTGNTPQVMLCDSTGNLTVISSSTSGYVLTSNGTATPSFKPAAVSPAVFSTYLTTSGTDVTGDGTVYQVAYDTVISDTASSFTTGATAHYTIPAGATGNWSFQVGIDAFPQTGSGLQFVVDLVTTAHTILLNNVTVATATLNTQFVINGAITVPMTAGDTAYITVTNSGGTKTTDIFGSANIVTWFSGSQIA